MKKIIVLAGLVCGCFPAAAQLKTTIVCPPFTIDILDGRIGDLDPKSTQGQIKKTFPCFTSAEAESDSAKCGGTVFYKDKDIYFYTKRDYVEIGPAFKGKLSIPLLGASRTGLFKWLGNPKIKDVSWDAYQTSYGILILYFNKANKINRIRFSTQSVETINLCE